MYESEHTFLLNSIEDKKNEEKSEKEQLSRRDNENILIISIITWVYSWIEFTSNNFFFHTYFFFLFYLHDSLVEFNQHDAIIFPQMVKLFFQSSTHSKHLSLIVDECTFVAHLQ